MKRTWAFHTEKRVAEVADLKYSRSISKYSFVLFAYVPFSSRMFLQVCFRGETDHPMRTRKTSRCLSYEGSKEAESVF